MNIPSSTVDIKYLKRILKNEYGKNKNYELFKNSVISDFIALSKQNPPILVNILIEKYLVKSKSDRKKLLSYFMKYRNLKVCYIYKTSSGHLTVNLY